MSPKKEERAPKTSPPGYEREKSAASSSASDRNQSWEVDTKNEKVHMMTIPGKACSRVIGKSGSNINAVRAHTTAVIEIDKKIGSVEEDRHIVVRGPPDVVKKACNIIQLCVEDTSLMIDEAIRLVDNHSVVSSASSDGTSKSIAESNQSSIPQSMSSASIAPRHSFSPVPSSSKEGHHHHHRNSKDQDGGNVWQQRMAARQEREPTPELPKNAVSSSPSLGPTPPPPHQPPHQQLQILQQRPQNPHPTTLDEIIDYVQALPSSFSTDEKERRLGILNTSLSMGFTLDKSEEIITSFTQYMISLDEKECTKTLSLLARELYEFEITRFRMNPTNDRNSLFTLFKSIMGIPRNPNEKSKLACPICTGDINRDRMEIHLEKHKEVWCLKCFTVKTPLHICQ